MRRKILYVTRVRAINKTVIKPSRDAKSCVSQVTVPQTDGKQYATYHDFPCVSQATIPQTDAKLYITYKHAIIPRETQNLASHKRICRKHNCYNIPHIIMLYSLWRRKILRLYKADATNITVINPSRDAKSCVSQATVSQTDGKQYAPYHDFPCVSQAAVPQTDGKQYATYNDFPCVSQATVPQTDGKQYATYNDFPCVSQAAVPQTDAKLYTTYKHAFIPLETQNLASLQGSRHQYKILLTLLMRYFMPYPYVPSSLAIRTFWLSAKVLFGLYIVFFFYIFPMKIK